MHKVWAVIRREFIERVRTKWFLVSTVLGPLFMIGMAVLPSLLLTRGGAPASIALVDEGAGTLADRVRAQLSRSGRFNVRVVTAAAESASRTVDSLTHEVRLQSIDGFLVL